MIKQQQQQRYIRNKASRLSGLSCNNTNDQVWVVTQPTAVSRGFSAYLLYCLLIILIYLLIIWQTVNLVILNWAYIIRYLNCGISFQVEGCILCGWVVVGRSVWWVFDKCMNSLKSKTLPQGSALPYPGGN